MAKKTKAKGKRKRAKSPTLTPAPEVTIEDRLEFNVNAASKGALAAVKMLDTVMAILDDPESKSDMRRAAAVMGEKAMVMLERANSMQRINAGLPSKYEKSETRGDLRVDYQPGQLREVAGRVFGFDFDGDNRPVSALPD